MKQVVRFAATPAGRVAYSVVGRGPALVYLQGWVSHLGQAWDDPSHRRFVEALARDHTVIRYDKLGCGLSDRPREALTLESELATLGALIGQLGLTRYSLFGSCEGGQVAAAHAAANPDAVTSLVVYGTCARGSDLAPEPVRRSILAMIEAHWGLGSRVLADIWLPGAPAEVTDLFARLQRASATGAMAAALLEMFYGIEVDHILPAIRVPTLVMHRRGSRAVRFDLGREVASLIPGAELAVLEGRLQPIYSEGGEAAAATILSFLGDRAGRSGRGSTDGRLTAREHEVVALVAEGLTNAGIAQLLGVSVRTVDAHVEHVRTKLGVRSRTQMAVWASEQRQRRELVA